MTRSLVLLKLGGSLLTDKEREETVHGETVRRLAEEISRARAVWRETRPDVHLLLGHGSGSFGHTAAARHRVHEGLSAAERDALLGRGEHEAGSGDTEQAARQRHDARARLRGAVQTRDRAAALHRLVCSRLAEAGALPWSLPPSGWMVTTDGQPDETVPVEAIERAFALGLLPVVQGDVVLDREQGFAICSTETVLLATARSLVATGRWTVERALWAGRTPGVLDAAGAPIPRIDPNDPSGLDTALSAAGTAAGTDVTGGMRHRLDSVLALARAGVPSLIFDGRVAGATERALAGGATGEATGATETWVRRSPPGATEETL